VEFHGLLAGSAPSCSSSKLARKLNTSVSPFVLLHGGCSLDDSSQSVCSTSSILLLLLLVCVSSTITSRHKTASSSTECSGDKPPFSFVSEQDSIMWDIVWISPQGHRSVSVSHHFLLHGSAETNVAEGGQNVLAGLWGHTLTSSYTVQHFVHV